MNFSSIVAVIGAFAVVLFTNYSEGDPLGALLNVEAAVIVLGGSFMAILGQFHLNGIVHGVKGLRWLVKPPQQNQLQLVENFVDWSKLVRKQGLLSLEDSLEEVEDPFLRDGLQMVVDGLEVETVRALLDTRIETDELDANEPAEIWDAVGGYAPTLGVLGAVMGLIHVMLHLHGSGNAIGEGIAAAFVATLYGVGSANLIFIPIGKRIARSVEEQARHREMIVAGLVLLAEGTNSQKLRTQLDGYISERTKKSSIVEQADGTGDGQEA